MNLEALTSVQCVYFVEMLRCKSIMSNAEVKTSIVAMFPQLFSQ